MLKSALMAAALALSAGFANAVTIEPGKSYVGDYSFLDASLDARCCQIISIDSPINTNIFFAYFGPNNLDLGETISVRLDIQAPPPPGEEDRNLSEIDAQQDGQSNVIGSFASAFFDTTSGQIGIRASGGSFDLTLFELIGFADTTYQDENGLRTEVVNLRTFVTNIREVGAPPPPPSPVPLPAALPLMLAGLLGLGLLRRRRNAA